jgi:protocatechuate 3,4-dioxygenase beta subunit
MDDCKCNRPERGETTHWGGNQVVVFVEEKSYRKIQGTIEMNDGRPLENALVEVFDHPEYLLEQSSSFKKDHPEQRKLAVCRTGADGKFCFRHLRSGKYELRSSIDSGWDVTHVYIVLDKKSGQDKAVHVQMELGT